jgi:hypothetical protein
MIKSILIHVGGIGGFGVLSICLFFAVFSGALLYAVLMKANRVDYASRLPLNDGTPGANFGGSDE